MVHNSVERSCKRIGIRFNAEDAQRIYDEVPTWGPHPDVPAGLARVAEEIPLVILSNSMNDLIMSNVEKLGAPVHTVITAEEVGAYKPLMKAFEYMLDKLARRQGQDLLFAIGLETQSAQFTSDPAGPEAAPQAVRKNDLRRIDPDMSGVNAFGQSCCAFAVATDDRADQTECGIVGQFDRLSVGCESTHGEDGPEQFLTP